MIRNVILDWSGTLVDDLTVVIRATNAVLGEYGASAVTRDQFRRDFVLPLATYYQRVLPAVPLPDIDKTYHEFFSRYRESVALLPDAESFLHFCRTSGRRVFLLSTVHAGHFEMLAQRFGIRRFFDEVYLEVVDKASQILDVLRVHELVPEETVFIGDMVHDLEAAKVAGVVSAAVLTGFDPVEKLTVTGPDLLLRDLGVLRTLWEPGPTRDEWIEIVGLEVSTHIGVPETERRTAQKLWLDLSFQADLPFDRLDDRLQRTVDYSTVAAAVVEFASKSECRLIETFATRVADLLEQRFPVRNLSVAVQKVVLPNTRCVRVRSHRAHGGDEETHTAPPRSRRG